MSAIPPVEVSRLAARLRSAGMAESGTVQLGPYTLEYLRPRAFATSIELLFGQRIYDVDVDADPEPTCVIDGGSWLGLSIIRFRTIFPRARIIGFEPDPAIYRILQRNLERNAMTGNVTLIPAALMDRTGWRTFTSTGSDAGSLTARVAGMPITVAGVPASDYLTEPGVLLKLNIEGAETEVVEELGERLRLVDHALIEYHGFSELPQTLHRILAALHQAGLTYVVSHINERNAACVPPLSLVNGYRYFLLVYARRLSSDGMDKD